MEDTLTEETLISENDALIEEMIAEAETAPEPGANDKVVHRGDDSQPAPMTVSELTSAGWCYIYDTKDGDRSIANRNMLKTLLSIKYSDGRRRFTTRKPSYSPKRGTFKCLLHQDSPDRDHFDEMGLPVCRKANLLNKHMVTQHMRKRHPEEWKAIEEERTEKERQEDRAAQKALYNVVTGKGVDTIGTEEAPLYVSKKDREKAKLAKT